MWPCGPLLIVVLLLSPQAVLADGPGPTLTSGPLAIYRGGRAEVPSAIPVLRGSSAMGLPAPPSVPESAPPAEVVAGDRLWLVDRGSGGLVACRLGASTQVGRDRIRCTAADLPE